MYISIIHTTIHKTIFHFFRIFKKIKNVIKISVMPPCVYFDFLRSLDDLLIIVWDF